MLVSGHDELLEFARAFRNYGKPAHEVSGLNFRLSEFTAAIGLVQTERLDELVAAKNAVAREHLDPVYERRCAKRGEEFKYRKAFPMTLDPVTLALVQSRLDHISHQMGWVMTRTARSPIFSQSHDFSCLIADAHGTLISQADGIPIHTGGGGFAVRAVLRDFAGSIAPEDVFLLNDPYTAGGNHLPDWVIARPVFVASKLVAFACNRAHQADIGGGAAGTYNSAATEIFHEGIRLPVLKLIEGGNTRADLWRLPMLNTRLPEALDGDLHAMIGSTRDRRRAAGAAGRGAGARRAGDFFEAVLDHADRRFRSCIDRLAKGIWRAEEAVDNDCFEPIDGRIAVTLTVADSRLWSISPAPRRSQGFKNSSIANSTSAVFMALASFFEPDLPRNEGTFRSVEIACPRAPWSRAHAGADDHEHRVRGARDHPCHVEGARPGAARSRVGRLVEGRARGDGGPARGWRALRDVPVGRCAGGGGVEGRDGFHLIGHLITLGGLTLPTSRPTSSSIRCASAARSCAAIWPGRAASAAARAATTRSRSSCRPTTPSAAKAPAHRRALAPPAAVRAAAAR